MTVRAAAAAALVAAALAAGAPVHETRSRRAAECGAYAPAPAPACPPGSRASPARPWVCFTPSVVSQTAGATLTVAASRAACSALSTRTPGAVAGGLATAGDQHEWGAMEAACAVAPDAAGDVRYARYWIGLRVNSTRSNRTRVAVDWAPVAGADSARTRDDFANTLVQKPAWAHSACDCRWDVDMPCNVKQTTPQPLVCNAGGSTNCVHMTVDPTVDNPVDTPWWTSGPAKWVARNDVGCETPLFAACCELHFNLSLPPFSDASAGAAAELRPNLPPSFSPSQTWGAFDPAVTADVRIGHVAQRGTTVLRVRTTDPDPPGTPAGIVSLRLVGAAPGDWVYVDPARLALLYSGPAAWGDPGAPPPPPAGVSRVYTVVAVDGLGCESATALRVRVTVLPSVPVKPFLPCPPSQRVGDVVVRWSAGGPAKCFARGPQPGSLRHPAQAGGALPWPEFVPAAAANASLGCADLQPGARVARAPALRSSVNFFDAAGRFVPGGVVSSIDYLSDEMAGIAYACQLGLFDESSLGPVWTDGHLRNTSRDGGEACRWRWVDDSEEALIRGSGRSGGRVWASLCDASLRNASDAPDDDGAQYSAGGAACMSAARRAGDLPSSPPVFSARRCGDELPPCCELLRSPFNYAANTPPRFTSQPRRGGVGDAARFDSVLITPLAQGLSIPIVVVDNDENAERCTSQTSCAGAEFTLERVALAGAAHRALISNAWREVTVRWLEAAADGAAPPPAPAASQLLSVTMRACDGLGACTDSDAAREPANAGYIQPDLELTLLALACSGPCTGGGLEAVPCRVPTGWTADSALSRVTLGGSSRDLVLDASRPVVNRLCLPWSTLAFGEAAEPLFSQQWAPQAGDGWGTWLVRASVLLGGASVAGAAAVAGAVLAWRAVAARVASCGASTPAAAGDAPPVAGAELDDADDDAAMHASPVRHEHTLASPPPGRSTGAAPGALAPRVKPGGAAAGRAAARAVRARWQVASARWLRDEWVVSALAALGGVAAGAAGALFLLCAAAIALHTPTARQLPDVGLPRYADSLRPAGTVWASPLLPRITAQHVANLTLGLPDVWRADRLAALGAGMPLSASIPAPWLPVVLYVVLALAVAARLALPLVVLLRVHARCDATLRRLVLGRLVAPGDAPALFQRAASEALRSLQLLRVYVALAREAPASLSLAVVAPCTQYSERYLTAVGHSMLRFAQRAVERGAAGDGGDRQGGGAPSLAPGAGSASSTTLGVGGRGDPLRDSRGDQGDSGGNARFSVAQAVSACRASVRIDVLALSATLDVALFGIVAFIVSPHQTHARGGALVTAFELAAGLHVLLLCSLALPWRALATVAAALDPAGAGPAPSSQALAAAHRHFEQQRRWGPLALLRAWAPATYDRLVCAHIQANGPLLPTHATRSLSRWAKMAAEADEVDSALGPGEAAPLPGWAPGLAPVGGDRSAEAAGAVARVAGSGSRGGSGSGSGSGSGQEAQELSNPLVVSRSARATNMRAVAAAAAASAAPLPPAPPALAAAHGSSDVPASHAASDSDADAGGSSSSGVARIKLAASFAHAPVAQAGSEPGAAAAPASEPLQHAPAVRHPAEKTAIGYEYARDWDSQ